MTLVDEELVLSAASSAAPAAFCWRRGDSGERVSCALCDILAVASEGCALLIHHYPLEQARKALDADGCRAACLLTSSATPGRLQTFGCCTAGAATRCQDLCRVRCASEGDAHAWVTRIVAALGPRPRRVAAFVNPVGGTGRALALYNTEVRP